MDRAEAHHPDFPPTLGAEPMQLRAFDPHGVFGDSSRAMLNKGRACLEGIAAESLHIIVLWRGRHDI